MRLLSSGVYYNHRDSSPSVGIGQLVLGVAVLIMAGVVLGGGAIVLLGNNPKVTPTHVASGPTPSGQPLTSPTQSAGLTLPPTPTLLATATPTPLPTLTGAPTPTPMPTPTPVPTPSPTPVNCAVASQGTNVKQWQLGLGHDFHKGPLPKTWCIRNVTIGSWSGWGTVRLMIRKQVIFETTCLPSACPAASQAFAPPYQANVGKTLQYNFTCFNDPATDVDECGDPSTLGAVITIDYEAFAAP